ncbi:MAG: glycosyltransferase family 4 protein [Planctomycetota bacterium]|jgi:glycosyltransferase involved in cell wall biosynthesis
MNYLCAVDSYFHDYPGGAARVALDIALLMREHGHQVTMICKAENDDQQDALTTIEPEGIQILRYKKTNFNNWSPFYVQNQIKTVKEVVNKFLPNIKWDIIHIHSLFTGAGVMEALGDTPHYLYTVHSPVVAEQKINWAHQGFIGKLKLLFGLKILKRLENTILHKASAIHVLSKFTKSQIQYFHGLADKIKIIPHWIQPQYIRTQKKAEARALLDWPQNIPILFTIRNHIPRTGLDIAIDAIAPLAIQKRCIFIVAGDGPMRTMLQERARNAGAGLAEVVFTGHLPNKKLMLAYQAADLFVLPTIELECFGLIILEALAMGCPIVATKVAAIPELLGPILPDFIVPANNVTAMRTKLQDYLEGKLVVPNQETLSDYVQCRYAKKVISQNIMDLVIKLTGK